MIPQSFGQALGKLIYEKRKALGLTQTQLAEDAFLSPGRVRRISELENGVVANPHPKTIDPLIIFLGIQESEIEECARIARSNPDPDLDSAYREARNLIEAIAHQFEHDNPDTSLAVLDEFLRSKAREWRTLRDRIQTSDADSGQIKDLKTKAKDALANARFDDADEYLANAEAIQQENKALKEVRKLAQLRITRAGVSYLAGNIEQATAQYLSAADFIVPFDEGEAVEMLSDIAWKFYEAGRRSIRFDFDIPIALLTRALQTTYVQENPEHLSKTYFRLSLVYRYVQHGAVGDSKQKWSDITTEYAQKAVEALPKGGHISDAISAKLSLGNALCDRAYILNSPQLAEEAIRTLKDAILDVDDTNAHGELRGHAYNSLGGAAKALDQLKGGDSDQESHDEAIKAFTNAISSAEAVADIEVWGIAHSNLAMLLSKKATLVEEKHIAHFYRLRAIGSFLTATEAYPSIYLPRPYAQCHLGLAGVLYDHATKVEDGTTEVYLHRSLASYELAANILDEESEPDTWAHIQMEIGRIHMFHAQLEGVETQEYDYGKATSHLEDAARVYNQLGSKEMASHCDEALAKFKEYYQSHLKS